MQIEGFLIFGLIFKIISNNSRPRSLSRSPFQHCPPPLLVPPDASIVEFSRPPLARALGSVDIATAIVGAASSNRTIFSDTVLCDVQASRKSTFNALRRNGRIVASNTVTEHLDVGEQRSQKSHPFQHQYLQLGCFPTLLRDP